jgi:hypothetical protein
MSLEQRGGRETVKKEHRKNKEAGLAAGDRGNLLTDFQGEKQ